MRLEDVLVIAKEDTTVKFNFRRLVETSKTGRVQPARTCWGLRSSQKPFWMKLGCNNCGPFSLSQTTAWQSQDSQGSRARFLTDHPRKVFVMIGVIFTMLVLAPARKTLSGQGPKVIWPDKTWGWGAKKLAGWVPNQSPVSTKIKISIWETFCCFVAPEIASCPPGN